MLPLRIRIHLLRCPQKEQRCGEGEHLRRHVRSLVASSIVHEAHTIQLSPISGSLVPSVVNGRLQTGIMRSTET